MFVVQQLQPSGARRKKLSATVVKIILIFLLFVVLLLAGFWFWSGSDGSLASALSFAQRYLGQGQTLVIQDVKGSLRHGGHLGVLQWEQEDLQLDFHNVEAHWEWLPLFSGKLQIRQFVADKVQIVQKPITAIESTPASDKTTSSQKPPSSAPQEIMLPMEVHIQNFQVASIMLGDAKKNSEVVSNLQGSYHFDKQKHVLKIDHFHASDGDYQVQANLTALAPTLDANLIGKLITQIPESDKKVVLDVTAKIAGPITKVNVDASVVATQESDGLHSPKADLKAVVMPWGGAMVLPKADLNLQSFNLNAFWVKAPVTLLSGSAGVITSQDESGKEQRAELVWNIKNAYQGALWQNRLPFSAINGSLLGAGQTITVQKLNASTGSGSIDVTGKMILPQSSKGTAQILWDLNITLNQVDPYLFIKNLASDHLSGNIKLNQSKASAVHFDVKLNAAQAANIAQFRVKQVDMQGNFENQNLVKLEHFEVKATDATVSGSASYALQSGVVNGSVKLIAPGLAATATMSGFSKTQGTVKVMLDLKSAELAYNWLKNKPINSARLLAFLEQLKGVTDRVDLLANLTQMIPVLVVGGWANPSLEPEIDMQVLISKVIEAQAKNKRSSGLERLEQKGKINEKEKELLEGVGGKLGDLMKKRK